MKSMPPRLSQATNQSDYNQSTHVVTFIFYLLCHRKRLLTLLIYVSISLVHLEWFRMLEVRGGYTNKLFAKAHVT